MSKLKIKNWFCSITQTKCILAITKDDDYLQNAQKQAQVKALERVGQMAYKLYGLTEIESDGSIHELAAQKRYDKARQK